MEEFTKFVRKVALHNKLANEAQFNEAEAQLDGDKNIVEVLAEMGVFKPAHVKQIQKLWEKKAGEPMPSGDDGTVAGATPVTAAPADDEPQIILGPQTTIGKADDEPAAVSAAHASAGGGSSSAMVAGPSTKDDIGKLKEYLKIVRDKGASDLHLCSEAVPKIRQHGQLKPLTKDVMSANQVEKILFDALTDEQQKQLRETKGVEFCMQVSGLGRYRTSMVKQRLGYDGAFRVVDNTVPTFESLGLPDALKKLTEYHQGLVLVTGPNGCGKSSTMAAMIELINQSRDEHVITIEDPVEYVFEPKKCQINQREVGKHTRSFSNALRASLREDPDVILIGELRDHETVSLAITAAETGHLVFGTLHTTSAARTIDRLLDVFPPDEQAQIRSMVSESIKGIVCQQLIPRDNGKGRALAMEIMFNTPAAANLIRERKMHQMASVMQTGLKQGMRMMDNSLKELVSAGEISGEDAYFAADNKTLFEQYAPKVS